MRLPLLAAVLAIGSGVAQADEFDTMMKNLNARPIPSQPAGAANQSAATAGEMGAFINGAWRAGSGVVTGLKLSKSAYDNFRANDKRTQAAIDLYNRKKAAHDARLTPEQKAMEDECRVTSCIGPDNNPQPYVPEDQLDDARAANLNNMWFNGPPDPYPNEPDPAASPSPAPSAQPAPASTSAQDTAADSSSDNGDSE